MCVEGCVCEGHWRVKVFETSGRQDGHYNLTQPCTTRQRHCEECSFGFETPALGGCGMNGNAFVAVRNANLVRPSSGSLGELSDTKSCNLCSLTSA